MVSLKNSTRLTVSLSLFQETFLTSTFQDDDSLKQLRYDPTAYKAETFTTDDPRAEAKTHQGFNDIQALHHEKPTLEARKVTKLHKRDTTSSYDEFPRYAQPYKLIPTTSTTHPVDNDTLDLYREGVTLSKFIHEGRPTTTKRLSLLFEPSDETIRRLYDIPINKNYIDDH